MSEIDWKTELKKIEREFDGLPPLLGPDELKVPGATQARAKARTRQLQTTGGAALRLGLVMALAAGLGFWPYAHDCGFGLFALLAVEAIVPIGGVWTILYTWRGRMPRAHALALLVVLWGLVLIAAQVLPRVGYARTPPGVTATWLCGGSGS